MNTKLLMIASSIFMGLICIALIFMQSELLKGFGLMPSNTLNLILQLLGALYFGFAMSNWMAKTILIGGIYSRSLSIGNFSHFLIAGIALVKTSFSSNTSSIYIYGLTIINVLFASLFGYIIFTNPVKNQH